ncbi:MAG: pseudaminic acid cytidylyltransferase, partial [Bacteroidota bacterium]
EENLYKRSQDLEKTYHDAGMFYFYQTQAYLSKKSVFKMNANAIIFEESKVQDIDTPSDWEMAEFKYRVAFGGYF